MPVQVTLPLRDFFNAAYQSKQEINYVTEAVVDDWISPDNNHDGRVPENLRARGRRDGTQRLAEGTGVMKKGGAYAAPDDAKYRVFSQPTQESADVNGMGDIELVNVGATSNPFRYESKSEALDAESAQTEAATNGSKPFEGLDTAHTSEAETQSDADCRWEVKGERAKPETEKEGGVKFCIGKARGMLGYPTEVPADAIWLPVPPRSFNIPPSPPSRAPHMLDCISFAPRT